MSEMEILPAVETCMASALAESAGDMRVMHSEMDTIVRKFSHLLYLPILRLTRPRDLYYYQGQGLCALYGFTYKYLHWSTFLVN